MSAKQDSFIPPSKKDRYLHELALKYASAKRDKAALTAEMTELANRIAGIMEKRGVKVYQHLEVKIELSEVVTPKVTIKEPADTNDDS